jgi:hypothetical protein
MVQVRSNVVLIHKIRNTHSKAPCSPTPPLLVQLVVRLCRLLCSCSHPCNRHGMLFVMITFRSGQCRPDMPILSQNLCLKCGSVLLKLAQNLKGLHRGPEVDSCRFEWPTMPNLTFSPAAGHLFPNAHIDVLVKYLVETPSRLEKVSGNLVVVEVTFPEGTITTSPWMAERAAPSSVAVPITTKAKSASAKGDADKQGPPLVGPSEPICTPITDSKKEIAFRVST